MNKCVCHINGYEVKDSKARAIANVEALRIKKNLEIGNVISTKGYYFENDGGEARYLIRAKKETDVENGGSIIFLSDSTLVAELLKTSNGLVNAKQFGAKGDGVTDDTQALVNLFTHASNILINEGVYKISSSINLNSNQIVTLINSRITSNSSNPIFKLINVENVNILGFNANLRFLELLTDNTCILINDPKNIKISGITFENYETAIDLFGTSLTSEFIIVKECLFKDDNALGIEQKNISFTGDVKYIISENNYAINEIAEDLNNGENNEENDGNGGNGDGVADDLEGNENENGGNPGSSEDPTGGNSGSGNTPGNSEDPTGGSSGDSSGGSSGGDVAGDMQ